MIGALTLDQLRVLVAVVETGSFSAAGRRLRRVQSAISNSVQSLEEVQQVALFDRRGRTPRLTEAGKVLTAQARQVLRQAELFERTAGAIAAGLEPELVLAVDSVAPSEPVIASLAGLRVEFPGLTVTLYTEGIWGGERRVRDGQAILAVCALMPVAAQDLQAYPLMSMQLTPVVASSHPLAHETRPVTREILAEHVQLILTNPQVAGGPSYSVVSPQVWRFVDLARRLEFLLAGFGWGTMPLHSVAAHLADGRLKRLDIDDPGVLPGAIPIYAVHGRTQPLGRAARWLLDDLRRREWPGLDLTRVRDEPGGADGG
jgi:DNA-binding transcriptional LysR family regulator